MSATQLSVPVVAADVATNTTISVTVSNPAPGGGVSNASSFVVGLGHNARLKIERDCFGRAGGAGCFRRRSRWRIERPQRSAGNQRGWPLGRVLLISYESRCPGAVRQHLCARHLLGRHELHAANDRRRSGCGWRCANETADAQVAISSDGRFVAFASSATNLLTGAPASNVSGAQIYVRDLCAGASAPDGCAPSTRLVSIDQAGNVGAQASSAPSVSADGRFVAFVSGGTVFVRDTCVALLPRPAFQQPIPPPPPADYPPQVIIPLLPFRPADVTSRS